MLPVYLALKFIYDLKHVMMRLSFCLNCLVSIASIAIISGIQTIQQQQESEQNIAKGLQGIQAFPDDYPSFPRCHVVRDTAYGRLVKLLASQNRLDQVLTVVEQFQPTPTAEMYFNLALALEYQGHRDQAEVINRWLSERYPSIEFSGKGRC